MAENRITNPDHPGFHPEAPAMSGDSKAAINAQDDGAVMPSRYKAVLTIEWEGEHDPDWGYLLRMGGLDVDDRDITVRSFEHITAGGGDG